MEHTRIVKTVTHKPRVKEVDVDDTSRLAVKLTPLQREIASGMVNGESRTTTAERLGVARSQVSQTLTQSQNVREYVRLLMDQAGIGPSHLVKQIRKGATATKREVTRDGSIVDTGPDHYARTKYLELAAKVYGLSESVSVSNSVSVNGAIVVRSTTDTDTLD